MSELTHKFEAAGLGKPPYRFLKFEVRTYQAHRDAPIQVGGSCDYCGVGIKDTYWFSSSDVKVFKVGSTCCKKAAADSKDNHLLTTIKREELRIKRERKHKRESERIERDGALLKDPAIRAKLDGEPHPNKWRSEQYNTKLDWAEWMMENAGAAGKITVCRLLKKLAKENG